MAFLTWLSVSLLFSHPFFISMTDINYNNKNRALEVSVRIFTDDFEKTLRKNCNCKVDLLHSDDKNAMNNVINSYILRHLQIKVDGQVEKLDFVGYQQEEESIWTYYEVKKVEQVRKIEINNTLLHDYRTEQINMLHIKANGKEQSDKLDYPEASFSGNF